MRKGAIDFKILAKLWERLVAMSIRGSRKGSWHWSMGSWPWSMGEEKREEVTVGTATHMCIVGVHHGLMINHHEQPKYPYGIEGRDYPNNHMGIGDPRGSAKFYTLVPNRTPFEIPGQYILGLLRIFLFKRVWILQYMFSYSKVFYDTFWFWLIEGYTYSHTMFSMRNILGLLSPSRTRSGAESSIGL